MIHEKQGFSMQIMDMIVNNEILSIYYKNKYGIFIHI